MLNIQNKISNYLFPSNTWIRWLALIITSLLLLFMIMTFGGAHNSFTILFIVIACMAAMGLELGKYISLIILILVELAIIYSGVFDVHHVHHHMDMKDHLQGMWIANSLAVIIGSGWVHYLTQKNKKIYAKHLKTKEVLLRLEKIDSLGKMMATTSHKLNTHLATIKLGLGELMNKDSPPSAEEQYSWYQDFDEAIEKMQSTIKIMQSPQAEDLDKKNKKELSYFQSLKQLSLNWAKPRKVNLEIKINGLDQKLSQDLINDFQEILLILLDNASESQSSNILVILEIKENLIYLRVKDQGVGIDPKIKNQIFDPLFTTKAQGTGIGLYSCHLLVQNRRGRIDIDSKINQGTSIEIQIPIS